MDKLLGEILQEIWDSQRRYNEVVKSKNSVETDWVSNYILGMYSEGDELLRELHTKHHRDPFDKVEHFDNLENIAMELADITKYALCLWQHFGFSVYDMISYVQIKGEVMDQLHAQEFTSPNPNSLIIVTDLDGTVADFRGSFYKYLVENQVIPAARTDLKSTYYIDEDLGIAYPRYSKWKDKFEREGGYRNLEEYPDAVEFLQECRREYDTYLVVVTARPKEIKRVWYDTWNWLVARNIKPDKLILGGANRIMMLDRYIRDGHRVILLEDDPHNAARAGTVGKVVVRDHRYNEEIYGSNIVRCSDFSTLNIEDLINDD